MNDETIFHLANQQAEAAARNAYLAEACAGDAEQRARVERLLVSAQAITGFLEPPTTPTVAGHQEAEGTLIGPYKLLERIGAGGMGEV